MFFSQTGQASWIGIVSASVLFGLLCAGACLLAKKTGAQRFSSACMRLFGVHAGRLIGCLHGLLIVVVGIVMLRRAGHMAALIFSVRHACMMGMLFSAAAALLLNVGKGRPFSAFSVISIVFCCIFHAALALDPEPVCFYQQFETTAELYGSVSAALTLAGIYAALCALIAVDAVMSRAERIRRSDVFALRCSAVMLAVLLTGNAAMLRGGEKLLSMALPTVVLAARWGVFGYFTCVFSMFLSAIGTLSVCLGVLIGSNAKHDKISC